MKEKIKERAKTIWEDHGSMITTFAILSTTFIAGYKLGKKNELLVFDAGLTKAISVKPEIETLIIEACETLNTR